MSNSESIDALRPEIWGKTLYKDVMDTLYFTENKLMGTDDNNIIQIKDELSKNQGDTVTFGLTAKLGKDTGITGDNELEGNESEITPYSESVAIDQWRDAVRLKGRLDEQKNSYNMRMDAKAKLKVRMQEFIEMQVFLKAGGVNNTTLVDVAGDTVGTFCAFANTPDYIPDADTAAGTGDRYLCANSSGAASLAATDVLTTDLIDQAALKAKLASPKIQPLRVNGRNYYIMFIHPNQAYDLKKNAVFAQARREAEVRGKENPIFTGALGIWNSVILKEHEYVPFLDTSKAGYSFRGAATGTQFAADAYRSLLFGKQAIAFAKCKNPNAWAEKTFDYGNKAGFTAGLIGGMQKVMFNSKEYGVIAVDTASSITVAA